MSVLCAFSGSTFLVHKQKKVEEGHCSALTNVKQTSLSLWMQFARSFLFSGLSSDCQHLSPSCSLPAPFQGLSAAEGWLGKLYNHPFLPSGLICFFCTCVTLFTKKQFCLA